MLSSIDTCTISQILTAPKVLREVAARYGLSGAELRVLLAITALLGEYSTNIPAASLHFLAAKTRLRAQLRALVVAGYITSRSRYRKRHVGLTTSGRSVVRAWNLAAKQACKSFAAQAE